MGKRALLSVVSSLLGRLLSFKGFRFDLVTFFNVKFEKPLVLKIDIGGFDFVVLRNFRAVSDL